MQTFRELRLGIYDASCHRVMIAAEMAFRAGLMETGLIYSEEEVRNMWMKSPVRDFILTENARGRRPLEGK